ncbi:tetratricopeptide repeat protein [Cognataquiflexum rubidum]|uniref:tetratricopeptide repeat protein n=1 Tax=Cognataquiflexum rubidum TaxID=2922273 RepID=UPI001F131D2E|nr:tetratricopeptide repeat protein [Cognataquiflexum rubidum]MCH6235811.1 tetratricopeptide repeat protein [Cognataquiflexum rubidum]
MKTRFIIFAVLSMLISCVNPKEKREEANRLWKDGKFDEALIAINKSIELEPDSVSNYSIRIFIYDATGKYEEEIADLTKVIELNKNSKSLNAHHQRAVARIQLGQYNKALSDIDYFIENISTDTIGSLAEAYLNKASILYKLSEFPKAKEFYKLTIKENDGKEKAIESQALVGLANLTKSPKEALKLLNKAIELDQDNAIAYGVRGSLFMEVLGNINEASKDLRTAIRLNPRNAILAFNMGQLFANYTDQLDSAVLYYEKAISLSPQSPNNGEIYMNLAVFSLQKGNLDKALIEFEKAEAIIPESDLVLYNYAMALSDFGKEDEALSKISKAIAINPDEAEYFNLKGSILLDLASMDDAEIAFKKAISINPRYGTANYNLGYLFGQLNDHTQSIKYYDKAVDLNFDLESTLVNRALQKFKINRTSDGCSDLKRAYSLGRTDIKPLIDNRCN